MKVLIGVTGSIASYRTPELLKRLIAMDIDVEVVLTRGAEKFIGAASFEGLIGKKVHSSLWEDPMAHIHLERSCDLVVICPATAHLISKLNSGLADDLLTSILLAKTNNALLVPAMNTNMWKNSLIIKNVQDLEKKGFSFLNPDKGLLACGEYGVGRLPQIDMIFYEILFHLEKKSFKNKKVLVTAGPTREFIDDVRFLSNPSSGKMGFSLALNAWIKGAEVTLVAGPGTPDSPDGIHRIDVESAEEMKNAIDDVYDYGFFTAAVTDFSLGVRRKGKPSKEDWLKGGIALEKNPDVLYSNVAKFNKIIGFSVYSQGTSLDAAKKVFKKGADYVVTNNVANCFGHNDTDVELFDNELNSTEFKEMDKISLGRKILDIIGDEND
tara:strand:+ start:4913 stop:6058 length:1146 start_codon:yes stop_codon:yes gene_type:complete